jgi:hypothetical protein
MVDVFKNLNKTHATLEGELEIKKLRPYLGMSDLGHSCPRYLWYTFRWCYEKKIERRILRLLERGKREEQVIINELKRIGIICYDEQKEFVMIEGHCKGHIDGICIGVKEAPKTKHLLEIKTMAEKYFKKTKKEGIKISKPIYYAQVQIYMYKFELTRTLFICVNKNNDELYIERIKLDKQFAEELEIKVEDIISSNIPPIKTFSPTWYECKFCDANLICHYGKEIEKNCRTCKHSDLFENGKWQCMYFLLDLSSEQQRLACKNYNLIPILN